MAPPAVADVRGGGGEFGLELQGLPVDDRIAGEADRIAVRAGAGVAGEGERAWVAFGVFAAVGARRIEVVQMVETPQRVEAGLAGGTALLPVEPPEVNALILHRMVELVEVGFHELRVGEVELHGLLGLRVDTHRLGEFGVAFLERAHAVLRVHVERDLHALLVQPRHEALRIGEEVLVPRVAGPAGTVLRVHVVDEMPVHVDHGGGERNAFLLEPFDERHVFGFGVAVVAAPPVAEREARQQRGRPGQTVEVVHGLTVTVSVGEQVEVGGGFRFRRHPCAERVRLAVDFRRLVDDVRC